MLCTSTVPVECLNVQDVQWCSALPVESGSMLVYVSLYPLKFYTHLQSGPVTSVFSIVSTHCNIEIINYSWWSLCFSFVEILVPGWAIYYEKEGPRGDLLFERGSIYFNMPLKYKFQGDQILQNIRTGGNKLRGNQFFVTGLTYQCSSSSSPSSSTSSHSRE